MRVLIGALLAAVFVGFSGPASAGGLLYRDSIKDGGVDACCQANWDGIYGAVSVGYGIGSGSLRHDWPGGPDTYDLGPDSVTGTVAVGFDRTFGGRWVWGLFADYTFGELDAAVSLRTPQPDNPLHLTYKDSWAVGGRLGFTSACCTLWYMTAGYTGATVEFEQLSDDIHGYFLGVGVEQQLHDGFSLKLEYRFSDYGETTLFNSATPCCAERLDVDSQIHAIRLGLAYKFGAHRQPERYEPLK
jgi:outer membrane immunogenic protein